MSYLGNPPVVQATRTLSEFVATAGQTTFTPPGGYQVGYVDVVVNGSMLQQTDFTATDGSTVVLASACSLLDDVRIIALGTFQVANATPADGSVTTAKLAAAAVTQAKLDANVAGNGPAFMATRSSGGSQSISAGVWTKLLYPDESYDTNNNYLNSTFTPTVAGYYWVRVATAQSNSGTQVAIYKNGAFHSGQNYSGSDWVQLSALVFCNGTTDTVEAWAMPGAGGMNHIVNTGICQFQAFLARAA